jgi:hypothetical protein
VDHVLRDALDDVVSRERWSRHCSAFGEEYEICFLAVWPLDCVSEEAACLHQFFSNAATQDDDNVTTKKTTKTKKQQQRE